MNITLTEAQRRFVEAKVAAGEFSSAEELVIEAIDLLRDIDEPWIVHVDSLFEPPGLDAIDEGGQESPDGETVLPRRSLAEIRTQIEEVRRTHRPDA